jgi:hypothetical protein
MTMTSIDKEIAELRARIEVLEKRDVLSELYGQINTITAAIRAAIHGDARVYDLDEYRRSEGHGNR